VYFVVTSTDLIIKNAVKKIKLRILNLFQRTFYVLSNSGIHKTVVDLKGEVILKIIKNGVAAWNLCIVIACIYKNDEAEINNTYDTGIIDTQQKGWFQTFHRPRRPLGRVEV
jgi:hypothetical protein